MRKLLLSFLLVGLAGELSAATTINAGNHFA